MMNVTLTINGRDYDIACEDDQAERIQMLGDDLNTRAQQIIKQVGAVSDTRLLLMVGLMLADEVQDTKSSLSVEPCLDDHMQNRLEKLVLRAEYLASKNETD